MCLGSSRYIKYLVSRRTEGREDEGKKTTTADGIDTVELCLTFSRLRRKAMM